jgi:WD40 repeat protein
MDPSPSDRTRADKPPVLLFLSYGRRDAQELADRLHADLEQHGYAVWQDHRRIRAGRHWEREIEEGLLKSQLVVALLSPHAVRRTNDPDNPANDDSVCLDEISFARFHHPRKIVPLMVEWCEPPLAIFRLHFVDFSDWREAEEKKYQVHLAELLKAIETTLSGEVHYRTWDHDLQPLDDLFAPFLEEKRRGFCGRRWLFDEIDAWRTRLGERALLLTCDPGTGKSALVAELVHRNPGGQVLAYHCCQWDTPETLRPARFVRSVAAMIASRLPTYAERLDEPAIRNALSEARCAADPASAFEEGVLAPLLRLPAPDEGVRYLLIDAMDEALAVGGSGPSILDVVAPRLERLPGWLRLLATSRKDPEVLKRLRGLRAVTLDAQDARNRADLEEYVQARLQEPALVKKVTAAGIAAADFTRRLCANAEGNFLYVQLALQGIEREQCSGANLLGLPPGLDPLYSFIFEREFPDAERFQPVRSLLESMTAAREPLTEEELAAASGLDVEDELPRLLRQLAVYLPCREGRYALYHKSLCDWLTDPKRRGEVYHVSLKRGHERLANLGWPAYQAGGVAGLSPYFLRHLPQHLAALLRWDDLGRLLLDPDLPAKAGPSFFPNLAEDLATTAALPESSPDRTLLRLLAEVLRADLHFLMRHPGSLFQCLWNRGWWYDSPAAAQHYELEEGESPAGQPWQRSGAKLYQLLEKWRTLWEARVPGARWLRALRPLPDRLGSAQRAVFSGHEGAVLSVAVSPDGGQVASASADGTVRLWDAASGTQLDCLEGQGGKINAVAFSPDGKSLVIGPKDGPPRLWDLSSRTAWRYPRPQQGCKAVAFSPNGARFLAVLTGKSVRLFSLTEREKEPQRLPGGRGAVQWAVWSPDGQHVAAAADTGVLVWDVAANAPPICLAGHQDTVMDVAFLPDGRLVSASADRTVRIWNVAARKELACLRGHGAAVLAVAASPDGSRIASAHGTIYLWDTKSASVLARLRGPDEVVCSLSFFPDGRYLACGSRDGTVRIWDVTRPPPPGQLRGHQGKHCCLAWTPDGRFLLTGSVDRSVGVWQMPEGILIHRLGGHDAPVRALAVSPDSRHVAALAGDGTLRVWNLEEGKIQVSLRPQGSVETIVFSADGQRLLLEGGGSRWTWPWAAGVERAMPAGPEDIPAAAGSGSPAWHLCSGNLEAEVRSRSTGEAAAWFPARLQLIAPHPQEPVWAAASGWGLYLLRLEGAS